jgi:hypothetical protein
MFFCDENDAVSDFGRWRISQPLRNRIPSVPDYHYVLVIEIFCCKIESKSYYDTESLYYEDILIAVRARRSAACHAPSESIKVSNLGIVSTLPMLPTRLEKSKMQICFVPPMEYRRKLGCLPTTPTSWMRFLFRSIQHIPAYSSGLQKSFLISLSHT